MSGFIESDVGCYAESRFSDLVRQVEKYEYSGLMRAVSKTCWDLWRGGSIGGPLFNVAGQARILMAMMGVSRVRTIFKKKRPLDTREFRSLCQLSNGVDSPVADNSDALMGWLIQSSYSQFIFNQSNLAYRVALFGYLFFRAPGVPHSPIDLDSYFKEAIGEAPSDYVRSIWILITLFQTKNGAIGLSDVPPNAIDSLKRQVCKLGRSLSSFGSSMEGENADAIFRFNPLRNYPIVLSYDFYRPFRRILRGESPIRKRWSCPIPIFLARQSTDGVFYRIFDHFLNEAKAASVKNAGRNQFARDFGKALEAAISDFATEELSPKTKVISEFTFRGGKNSLYSADVQLCDKKAFCMVQVKGKRVTLRAQQGNLEAYRNDIDNCLVYGLEQNLKLLSNPEYLKEIKIRSGLDYTRKTISFLVLYPEGFYSTQYPPIREYIARKVEELIQKYSKVENRWHFAFASIETAFRLFEWCSRTRRPVGKIISDYQKYVAEPEKSGNLGISGFTHSFDDYVMIKSRGQLRDKTLSQRIYDSLMRSVHYSISEVLSDAGMAEEGV